MRGACLLWFLLWGVSGALAGDGVVALQTADPSCADDSDKRYVDCGNGTVTDNDTGLVWLADANCLNPVDWVTTMDFAAGLSDKPADSVGAEHDCGLSDGSSPGEWRLPSVTEWEEMIADAVALGCTNSGSGGPSITDDSGTLCWQEGSGSSFAGVESVDYWSVRTSVDDPANAWVVSLNVGDVGNGILKTSSQYFWPVRGGQ